MDPPLGRVGVVVEKRADISVGYVERNVAFLGWACVAHSFGDEQPDSVRQCAWIGVAYDKQLIITAKLAERCLDATFKGRSASVQRDDDRD